MKILHLSTIPFLVAITVGCANQSTDTIEKNSIVQRYDTMANQMDAKEYAPIALDDAEEAVNNLKEALRDGEGVDHYSHIASRRLDIVELKVDAVKAQQLIDAAEVKRKDILLSVKEQRIQESERELKEYRSRAAAAESKAKDLQKKAEKLAQENEGLSTRLTDKGLVLSMNNILFELNSDKILQGSERTLSRISDFLNENPENAITVSGHTDSTGDEAYNLMLSEQRAKAVKRALVQNGVKESRVKTEGLGEAYPVASNDSRVGRQQNRRVEIVIHSEDQVARNK